MLVSLTCGLASAWTMGQARPSHAYGGQKQLAAMDAGSGNKDYETLMKAIKARREAEAAEKAKAEPKAESK